VCDPRLPFHLPPCVVWLEVAARAPLHAHATLHWTSFEAHHHAARKGWLAVSHPPRLRHEPYTVTSLSLTHTTVFPVQMVARLARTKAVETADASRKVQASASKTERKVSVAMASVNAVRCPLPAAPPRNDQEAEGGSSVGVVNESGPRAQRGLENERMVWVATAKPNQCLENTALY
jgi:hypothetical protein